MGERPHKKLLIWGKILYLVEDIYLLTEHFPRHEMYGLSTQMRRAVVSIASNVAEGSARRGKMEKLQFYNMAKSSLSELDAQLEISLRLHFIDKIAYDRAQGKIDEVSRMLQGLINNYKERIENRD